MQKDFHFYVTHTLCILSGMDAETAKQVAWANQYVDDCTSMKLYGIQTQSALLSDWYDKQIQYTVLIPFHFMPGHDPEHPWMVTRNNTRAKRLVAEARGPFELGVALHVLQDTFSHEGFSGWQEDLNRCYPWYKWQAIAPAVGHAEMQVVPDVTNYVWTDPRDGRMVDNTERALLAARATLMSIDSKAKWTSSLESSLGFAFHKKDYDTRKQLLRDMAGQPELRYKHLSSAFEQRFRQDFVEAASNHLSRAVGLFAGLPRVEDDRS